MEEVKDCYIKIDPRVFLPGISTEALRILREEVVAELRKRAKEAKKNLPPPKPEYRFWTGKIMRRSGDVFSRYRFRLEPSNPEELPEEVREKAVLMQFPLLSGSFKKDTCPKIGDVVVLKYRVLKRTAIGTCFHQSRIISLAPKKVVGCSKDWNCLNIIANDDRSHCPSCPNAVME